MMSYKEVKTMYTLANYVAIFSKDNKSTVIGETLYEINMVGKILDFIKNADKTEGLFSSPMDSTETYFVNTMEELEDYIKLKHSPNNLSWIVTVFHCPPRSNVPCDD